MKSFKVILALILSLASFSLAMAQPHMREKGMRHRQRDLGRDRWFFHKKILADMGVNPSIISQMEALMKDLGNTMRVMQDEIGKVRESIRTEMLKDPLDENKLKELFLQLAEIRKQQQLSVEENKLKSFKLLTPLQRKKFFTALDERRKKFWEYMKPGFKRGFHRDQPRPDRPDED